MFKGKQSQILSKCCATIDQRVDNIAEPYAKQFANTWLEGAITMAVFCGKNDLAESIGRMAGEVQQSFTWAAFRQKVKTP